MICFLGDNELGSHNDSIFFSWSLNIPRLFGNGNWNSRQRLSYSFGTLRYIWGKTVTFYDPQKYKIYVQILMKMRGMYCWNFSFMVPWVHLFTSCLPYVQYIQWYSWQAVFSQLVVHSLKCWCLCSNQLSCMFIESHICSQTG